MKALIIDDEILAAKYLKKLLSNSGFPFSDIDCIYKSTEALSIDLVTYDILFLDMNMPKLNGTDFLKKAKLPPQLPIIITTAHDKYAIDAYGINTVGFLVKPVEEEELIDSLIKAENYIKSFQSVEKTNRGESGSFNPKKLKVLSQNEYLLLDHKEIIRIEADGSYSVITTLDSSYIVSKRLSELEKELHNDQFQRIHKSHLINLASVSKLAKGKTAYVVLSNGDTVPLSANKKEGLINALGI